MQDLVSSHRRWIQHRLWLNPGMDSVRGARTGGQYGKGEFQSGLVLEGLSRGGKIEELWRGYAKGILGKFMVKAFSTTRPLDIYLYWSTSQINS